jgi:hypothetical protein
MIKRIPVPLSPEDNPKEAAVKVEKEGVKDEKEGGDYIEINGTRYKKWKEGSGAVARVCRAGWSALQEGQGIWRFVEGGQSRFTKGQGRGRAVEGG